LALKGLIRNGYQFGRSCNINKIFYFYSVFGVFLAFILYALNVAMAFAFLSSLYGDFMKVRKTIITNHNNLSTVAACQCFYIQN